MAVGGTNDSGGFNSAVDTIAKVAKVTTPVAPSDAMGRELKSKKQSVDEFNDIYNDKPLPKAEPVKPSHTDLVNPKRTYGDKEGQKRGEKRIPNIDEMRKPISSLKEGTDYVPKTGNYKLHEGEKVVPKKENKMDHEKLFDGVPGRTKEKSPKKEIKEIHIRKSHNGKHIVKHVHHHSSHPDEEHVMNDMAELHKHIDDHAGTPEGGEGEGGAGAPGADQLAQLTASPAPAAPTAAPQAGGAVPMGA